MRCLSLRPYLARHFRLEVYEWVWYIAGVLDITFPLVLTSVKLPNFSAAFGKLLLLSSSVSPPGKQKTKKTTTTTTKNEDVKNLCLPLSPFELIF